MMLWLVLTADLSRKEINRVQMRKDHYIIKAREMIGLSDLKSCY